MAHKQGGKDDHGQARAVARTAVAGAATLFPQTWGWLLLAALLGAALLGQLARRYRRWLHDAYRREALACLVYVERAQ
ncbi:DUF4381 family protein [Pseudomonas sp. PDM18]|uniref:DUF4381 family protein n=1 Tax=Pseudomonas sp. PDM18 TaxID=2769253 RepID=UPI0017845DC8|nr:DUF4381 family protein [Pseudomonas sp. PDM18]MBD9676535.1 DUF4381 family protein [Pseudomonas sp. PDM18]